MGTSAFAVALSTLSEMVVVVDERAEVYRRIWCIFELYYASRAPRDPKIWLANEKGVISSGAASMKTVDLMRDVVDSLDLQHAEASVEADRLMIWACITDSGWDSKSLHDLLKGQVAHGRRMTFMRAMFLPVALVSPASCVLYATLMYRAVTERMLQPRFDNLCFPIIWFSSLVVWPPCLYMLCGLLFITARGPGDEGLHIALEVLELLSKFAYRIAYRKVARGHVWMPRVCVIATSVTYVSYAVMERVTDWCLSCPYDLNGRVSLIRVSVVCVLQEATVLLNLLAFFCVLPRNMRLRYLCSLLVGIICSGISTYLLFLPRGDFELLALVGFLWVGFTLIKFLPILLRDRSRRFRDLENRFWE